MEPVKRFDRIVAILIQLQSKRIVKAQELAERFQVTLRTIYRDIRSLEEAGVPILSEAGVGYSIMDGYRLPPIMFTKEEAASFVAAQKLMQQLTDKSLGAHYESALFKLKSVLRGKDKDWVEALENQISYAPSHELFNAKVPDALEIILEGIATQHQVHLSYTSLKIEDAINRIIEPVGIFNENNFWYILAFCQLRKDYRQFRTDRIQNIKRTGIPFSKTHPSLEELRKQEELPLTKVRICVSPIVAKFLGSKKNHGWVSEEKTTEGIVMTFMVADVYHNFARWYLSIGDYARVLEPEHLKKRLTEILYAQLKALQPEHRLTEPPLY
ncbi:YafY family protein [Flavobacterium sp. ASW18X]|uniref:helix-turn-helix transcriptional regulator n=1 Tax=Flavobacterium sp. ASW18X TaxID=2572595 RepID=UPI0010AE59A5|nr:YafY family protein [Flavobacterium sp. ASW18X]TKD65008.1 YafY family transcriptional regulator [Flavobacterium sp. ASW18X]